MRNSSPTFKMYVLVTLSALASGGCSAMDCIPMPFNYMCPPKKPAQACAPGGSTCARCENFDDYELELQQSEQQHQSILKEAGTLQPTLAEVDVLPSRVDTGLHLQLQELSDAQNDLRVQLAKMDRRLTSQESGADEIRDSVASVEDGLSKVRLDVSEHDAELDSITMAIRENQRANEVLLGAVEQQIDEVLANYSEDSGSNP